MQIADKTPSTSKINSVRQKLSGAHEKGLILQSSREECNLWLDPDLFEPWVLESIAELVEKECWDEINDRFYKTLAFGTGGLRGRTIGHQVTSAERGKSTVSACPEHPAVGSNCMNDFNVRRAIMGMVSYIQQKGALGPKPHLVFAHDTRYFSRHFAELAANTVIECGGDATIFESERSTPELSFAVRHLDADGGVVITASHNPPHDNGFKAYFADGGQVVEPHASGIINEVAKVSFQVVCRKKRIDRLFAIAGSEIDEAYTQRVRSLILENEVVRKTGAKLKVVYSPLHGTGAKLVPQLLRDMHCQVFTVPEQMVPDGRFPTVKSPNPENAEALTLSIRLAEKMKADLVLATDPDGDRMGVAILNKGKMELLSGNQIGSLLAFYRLERLFSQRILNDGNRQRARLIKTVVTTNLQKAIAEKFGVGIPETLTGFKYIGQKLDRYEEKLRKVACMDRVAYQKMPEKSKRDQLLQHACYYVFGGEESYGYSANDFTRDKDANAACLMFAELAIFAKANGQTVLDYLNQIYAELGYYSEKLGQLVYEGAEGAEKIKAILRSYETNPPHRIADLDVVKISNYAKEDIRDSEGDLLPKELLFFVDLKNGARYAVRGSGTEPKIKFYLFAVQKPDPGKQFTQKELTKVKADTAEFLDDLWKAIEADAKKRAGS